MTKALKKLGIEGTFFNILKAVYEKPRLNIILIGEQLKLLPLKVRNDTRISTFSTPIQHGFVILAREIRQEQEIKGIQIGKEEVKLSLFANDMILCLRNPQNSTKNLLEIINSAK
jgi:hypothetical protein